MNGTAATKTAMARFADEIQGIDTEVLMAIARGDFDARKVAALALCSRGVGVDGKWAGFDEAADEWNDVLNA